MLETHWVEKAEFRFERLRKAAEEQLHALDREFCSWQKNDARRAAIMRLSSTLFVPVVSLYTMRVHMADPGWWEEYAPGAGAILADSGRTAFDRGIKGKLILDIVANVEHSFRLLLNELDPGNRATKFSAICQSLLRTASPHLNYVPPDWEPPFKLLRLTRNTIHSAWCHFPDNGKDETVIYKGIAFGFLVGRPLEFISWDFLANICEDVLKIVIGVVRDVNVIHLSSIKDFGVQEVASLPHNQT
jgi:hypothetical protein